MRQQQATDMFVFTAIVFLVFLSLSAKSACTTRFMYVCGGHLPSTRIPPPENKRKSNLKSLNLGPPDQLHFPVEPRVAKQSARNEAQNFQEAAKDFGRF